MELPEIKQQLSILDVLGHYQLSPDRNNRLKCPLHDDKTPSIPRPVPGPALAAVARPAAVTRWILS